MKLLIENTEDMVTALKKAESSLSSRETPRNESSISREKRSPEETYVAILY